MIIYQLGKFKSEVIKLSHPRNLLKLSNIIYNELREMILSKRLSVGTPFYSERDIMEKWSCSRATAREALLLLEFEGLISTKPGQGGGVFVGEPNPKALIRLFESSININHIPHVELIEARKELEISCAKLAAIRATQEDIDYILDVMHEFEKEINNPEKFKEKNLEFHMAIAMAAHNKVLLLLMKVLEELILEETKQFDYSENQKNEIIKIHKKIVDAIVNRDQEAAMRRMGRHLEGFENVILQKRMK
jgi:GntR family transcriptional regulator, transcriptional repressor for pyruvate dehydrogenase complex